MVTWSAYKSNIEEDIPYFDDFEYRIVGNPDGTFRYVIIPKQQIPIKEIKLSQVEIEL